MAASCLILIHEFVAADSVDANMLVFLVGIEAPELLPAYHRQGRVKGVQLRNLDVRVVLVDLIRGDEADALSAVTKLMRFLSRTCARMAGVLVVVRRMPPRYPFLT